MGKTHHQDTGIRLGMGKPQDPGNQRGPAHSQAGKDGEEERVGKGLRKEERGDGESRASQNAGVLG